MEKRRYSKAVWEIPRESLQFSERLKANKFWEVWKGTWNDTADVAIKKLKPGAMTKTAFLEEAQITKLCRHEKLVRVYAVCSLEEPIYIVMELLKDSFLNYLREGEGKNMNFPLMVHMASQVASGMAYLKSNKIIHRDLAAKNILVGEKLIVKVANFDKAKILEEDEYDPLHDEMLQIKWAAPEASPQRRFTIKSDVWSFGILLVEITTRGQVPYPGMTDEEVLNLVERGYRQPQPPACSDPMYEMMLKCWNEKPDERPTFEYLFTFFDDYFIATEPYYDKV